MGPRGKGCGVRRALKRALRIYMLAAIAMLSILMVLGSARQASLSAAALAEDAEVESMRCAQCHSEVVERFAGSAHRALACVDCHAPYSEPCAAPRIGAAVCMRCHSDHGGTNTHPVDTLEDPLTGGALTCTSSCHDPHASVHSHMLRVPYEEGETGSDAICLRCHTGVGVDY